MNQMAMRLSSVESAKVQYASPQHRGQAKKEPTKFPQNKTKKSFRINKSAQKQGQNKTKQNQSVASVSEQRVNVSPSESTVTAKLRRTGSGRKQKQNQRKPQDKTGLLWQMKESRRVRISDPPFP